MTIHFIGSVAVTGHLETLFESGLPNDYGLVTDYVYITANYGLVTTGASESSNYGTLT